MGKTGLASGLLLKAIQNGYRGQFMRAQDLFDDMYASLADRSSRKLLDRLVRVDVLVIDEMGYLNLKPEQTNIFFKLMEERYRYRPTIITTNLAYEEWHHFLGNKALVDALLSPAFATSVTPSASTDPPSVTPGADLKPLLNNWPSEAHAFGGLLLCAVLFARNADPLPWWVDSGEQGWVDSGER